MGQTSPKPPDRQLLEALMRASRHVFETNLVRRTNLSSAISLQQLEEGSNDDVTISVVRFSGDRTGGIGLVTPNTLNHIVAAEVLGIDESQLAFGAGEAVYRDAAGELVNMVAGSFKGVLSRSEINCRLQPPLSIREVNTLSKVLGEADQQVCLRFELEEFSVIVSLWVQTEI